MHDDPIPRIVKLHVAFAACVTLAEGLLFLPDFKVAREAVVPLTGWAASMPYLGSLLMSPFLWLTRRHHQHRMVIRVYIEAFCSQLAIYSAISLIYFFFSFGREDYGNPYLMVSAWRPIWIGVIPAAWWFVLRKELKAQQNNLAILVAETSSDTDNAQRNES